MTEATAEIEHHTLLLRGDDLEAAFDWSTAIAELTRQYGQGASEAMFPPRTMARGDGIWLRTLSGIAPSGDFMGAKLIAANTKRGRASYLIALFDQDSMELVTLIDGNAVTGYRTASTTALGIDKISKPGAISVGVLGSGFEARNHIRALNSIRELKSVTVFSPNPKSRKAFAEALADLDVLIEGRASARDVVEAGPDVLLCAARSRDEQPLFDGNWLQAGMTVASIGSTLPEQREIDSVTIARANIIVADMPEEVIEDTGDMIAARAANVDFDHKVVSLASVVDGSITARKSDQDITLYKSVGGALQDIAVAAVCLRRARELGLGVDLGETIKPVLK